MTVGERIRAARTQAGVTQVQVAGAVGIDQTTLSSWERGHDPAIRAQALGTIAEMLGVSVEWLLYGDRGEPTEPREAS